MHGVWLPLNSPNPRGGNLGDAAAVHRHTDNNKIVRGKRVRRGFGVHRYVIRDGFAAKGCRHGVHALFRAAGRGKIDLCNTTAHDTLLHLFRIL